MDYNFYTLIDHRNDDKNFQKFVVKEKGKLWSICLTDRTNEKEQQQNSDNPQTYKRVVSA